MGRYRTDAHLKLNVRLTEMTRETLAAWLELRGLRARNRPVAGRRRPGEHATTRRHRRLGDEWVTPIGLGPPGYGTHSLRRTKIAPISRRTGSLRARQLLGHTKPESAAGDFGIEADGALAMSEQADI